MDTLDVVVVGAGFGGIGAAIQLKRLGYDNIAILDRDADLGGTWNVNTYPGLAVDIPATTYSYWFEPNPYWSRLFPPGAELRQYAENVAEKYDVRRYMRFNTTVECASWDDDERRWQLTLAGGERLTTRFLITATGFLSQPKSPEIAGIESFAGKVIYTTAWDHDYDLSGRRIGIIGTGATAVQLIPELAAKAAELTVYQRTPTHILPKIDFPIPLWLRRIFARVPLVYRFFRLMTDTLFEVALATALHHKGLRRLDIAMADLAKINRFIWLRDKELRRKFTPDYDFGCKRPTWSSSYYRTFTKPHVHLETNGIQRIEPDGIVTADGHKTAIDTLVLATGFDLWDANFPAFEVVGRRGRNLGKWWRENKFRAYQGLTVPYFPNFLSMGSPYAFSGFSFFHTVEYQMRHMDRLFTAVQRARATEFEVTEEANAHFNDRMDTLIEKTLFAMGTCAGSRSYYFNPDGDAKLLRPTSSLNAIREASQFPLTDYVFR
ncbi:monooxygenase [Mycobacterium sp. 1100029.7]|nr:monooxygenase [Mycobacterium sp. 1100029.7]